MKDIARACGFEPSNIYNYFKSKELVLYDLIKAESEMLVSEVKYLDNDDTKSPTERLKLLIRKHINLALGPTRVSGSLFDSENRHLLPSHLKTIIKIRNAYEGTLRNIIRAGIDNGDFADMDDMLVAYAIAAIIIRSRIWFSPKGRLSANDIGDFTIEFALNGLKFSKERKLKSPKSEAKKKDIKTEQP